jgi:protein involved in polysaccharide export with SLBB domain
MHLNASLNSLPLLHRSFAVRTNIHFDHSMTVYMTRNIVATLALVCLLTAPAVRELRAQGSGGFDLDKLMQSNRSASAATQLLQGEQLPTDNVVDPHLYVVGPGDVLAYQGLGLDLTEKLLAVTPENTVLVERYGVIRVEGMTLAKFRDTLKTIIRGRNPSADPHITLRRARLVYVRVSGNVPYPGTYAVPASMRVSTFLTLSSQPWTLRTDPASKELGRTDKTQEQQNRLSGLVRTSASQLSPYAQRNIVVQGRYSSRPADLFRGRVRGYEYLDPHVREEDHIIVPFDAPSFPTISVAGAFVQAMTIPWKRGDDIGVLLAASGGIAANAKLGSVRLERRNGESVFIPIGQNGETDAASTPVQPGDVLYAEEEVYSGIEATYGIVEVSGEVQRSGAYRIVPGTTRVSQVLSMAGGVRPQAALNLAYIVRRSERLAFMDHPGELQRRFQYSDLVLEDSLRYRLDQTYRLPVVSCDMVKAVADTGSESNVVLYDGDRIIVPAQPTSVFVYGQVTNPGYVQYQPGKSMEWYVFQAGGYALGAKPGRARVVRGRTNVWHQPDNERTIVEPGDEVYVPRAPDVPAGMDIQYYAVIGGVVSSLAALAGVLFTILR